MGLDVAAAFPIQGLTAWHLLHNVSVTKPGDMILIHAIGGGVGLFATQLAVRAGATVIGTVGTKGKERARSSLARPRSSTGNEDFVAAPWHSPTAAGRHVVELYGASILDRSSRRSASWAMS